MIELTEILNYGNDKLKLTKSGFNQEQIASVLELPVEEIERVIFE